MNNSSTPQLSVVIPVHNRQDTIGRAVQSALRQKNVLVEVVVVDDASSDDTVLKVLQISDPRVRLVRNPLPSGGKPGVVRNLGVKQCRASIVLFLDSDDALPEGAAKSLIACFEPGVGLAWGYKAIWRGSKRVSVAFVNRITHLEPHLWEKNLLGWTPGTGGLCFRKEVFDSLGGFDSSLGAFEDLDFTLRFALARKWTIKFLDCITYDCHVTDGISSNLHGAYLEYLERYFRKHGEVFSKYADARAHFLYRLGTTAYLVGQRYEGKNYFDALYETGQSTLKHRIAHLFLQSGLGFVLRMGNRFLVRVQEKKRNRLLREKKAA